MPCSRRGSPRGSWPLEGPGLVLQLEDSQVPVPAGASAADYRVSARDLRSAIEELWLAGAEAVSVNGERIVPMTAIVDIGGSVLVNSAYLAPPYQVAAIGPADLYDVLAASPRVRRPGPGARRPVRHPGLVRPAQDRDRPGVRRLGDPALRSPADGEPDAGPLTMRQPRSQIALAAVALLLGFLVVVQLNAQQAGTGLETQSSQDLTLLVANVTTRNDQLRGEVADLQRQLDAIDAARAGGETSLGQLRADLERVRIWSGIDAASGAGIRVLLYGGVPAGAVSDLINELRNAGAEAISVGGVRVVAGTVVAGPTARPLGREHGARPANRDPGDRQSRRRSRVR